MKPKGLVLVMVLAILILVIFLAQAVIVFILSESKLTFHKANRLQAFYASRAGMNYALEKLRIGGPTGWYYIDAANNSCPPPPPLGGPGDEPCYLPRDDDFPRSILSFRADPYELEERIRIIFCPRGWGCVQGISVCEPPDGIDFCIYSTVRYIRDY